MVYDLIKTQLPIVSHKNANDVGLGFAPSRNLFLNIRPSKKKCLFAKIRVAKIISIRQAGTPFFFPNFQVIHTN